MIQSIQHLRVRRAGLVWLLFSSSVVFANPRIAVLNIELDDISALPRTPAEMSRTNSFKPMLEAALSKKEAFTIMPINAQMVATENAGFGYLFQHHEVAAKLGKAFGADWVLVGQHFKASFLYSDVLIHLVNVQTGALKASYAVELKGNVEEVSQRAMQTLALKIQTTLVQP